MDNPGSTQTMELPPMAQLARKMANIMGQLKRLRQGGQNQQGWTFTSIDDITDAIRALMAEHGIALFSKMLKATQVKDGKTTLATVDMEFELVCADTGAAKIMSWTGSAEDYSDKAINKAAVYAEKFWLKSTFLVSTGKDPDAKSPGLDRRNEQPRQQAQRPAEPAKPAVVENRQPTPAPSVLKPWLDAEKKMALVLYAIEDKLLEQDDVWSDFLKLGELSGDEDCLKFASGNDLYKHVKERAATIKKTAPAVDPVVSTTAAQITVDDTKNLLGTPKGSSTRPTVTSNGAPVVTGATSSSPFGSDNAALEMTDAEKAAADAALKAADDDIPPDPGNPHLRKRPTVQPVAGGG